MQIAEPLLGTRAEVHATATSATISSDAEHAVLAEVGRLERLFTVFDQSSALNELRRTGATEVPELLEVLDLARYWHDQSDGVFDSRVQMFMALWDESESAGSLPSRRLLAAALAARDQTTLSADNLNAIAKGWIAQHAIDSIVAVRSEIHSIWLSLGGDVVHRGTGTMAVGIEDPHRPYDNVPPLAVIEISNESVATSGGSHRWWTIQGQRYPKVLDPRTGWPVQRAASATVVAPDAATADALATIAIIADMNLTFDLAESAGAECLLVLLDGSRQQTSNRFRVR